MLTNIPLAGSHHELITSRNADSIGGLIAIARYPDGTSETITGDASQAPRRRGSATPARRRRTSPSNATTRTKPRSTTNATRPAARPRPRPQSQQPAPADKYRAEFKDAGGEKTLDCSEAQYVETALTDEAGGVVDTFFGSRADYGPVFRSLDEIKAMLNGIEAGGYGRIVKRFAPVDLVEAVNRYAKEFRDSGGEAQHGVSAQQYVETVLRDMLGGTLDLVADNTLVTSEPDDDDDGPVEVLDYLDAAK